MNEFAILPPFGILSFHITWEDLDLTEQDPDNAAVSDFSLSNASQEIVGYHESYDPDWDYKPYFSHSKSNEGDYEIISINLEEFITFENMSENDFFSAFINVLTTSTQNAQITIAHNGVIYKTGDVVWYSVDEEGYPVPNGWYGVSYTPTTTTTTSTTTTTTTTVEPTTTTSTTTSTTVEPTTTTSTTTEEPEPICRWKIPTTLEFDPIIPNFNEFTRSPYDLNTTESPFYDILTPSITTTPLPIVTTTTPSPIITTTTLSPDKCRSNPCYPLHF